METEEARRNKHQHDGWIGVDLDGTLAWYDSWRGEDHIGEPIKPMLDRVKSWLKEGKEVRILTARVCSCQPPGVAERARLAILAWSMKHLGRHLAVVSEKDYHMVELWDDRCVQIITNTGVRADGRSR